MVSVRKKPKKQSRMDNQETNVYHCKYLIRNHISGVMVSVLAASEVDRGIDPRSGQAKDYTIGICCFSAKHAALRRKEQRLVGSVSG